MASINDLDNPLLVLILNRLCIQKLFTAGHVCVRWNAMRDMSAGARKELTLLFGNDAKRYIDESAFQIPERRELVDDNGDVMFPDQSDVQLQVHSFPLQFSRFLHAKFGNLTSLTISCRAHYKELDSIIHLLQQFSRPDGTLQSLKLYSNQDNESNTELNKNQNIRAYRRLLSTVNSIGSLRTLTFDVNAKFGRNAKSPQIDLPILAQLEEFEFNSADEQFSCLYDSITRYAVNNHDLRRIGIDYSTADFTWLLALSPELSSRFTHLNILLYHENCVHFENLCLHFSNLTSLKISVIMDWRYTIFTLFHPLTNLPHLTSLVININGGNILRVRNQYAIVPFETQFELPSVKVLTINYQGWHDNHHFFHRSNIDRILPNVQVVRIICLKSICCSCLLKFKLTRSGAIEQIGEHCARHMFRNFAQCQHLRMVCSIVTGRYFDILGPRNRRWHWNEIGPF